MGRCRSQSSSYISLAIALAWLVMLAPMCDWICAENWLVGFRMNLWTVEVTRGRGVDSAPFSLMQARRLVNKFDNFAGQRHWISDARGQFCTPGFDMMFDWCGQWGRAYWSSRWVVIFVLLAVVCHVVGALLVLYHVNEHATRAGRTWTTVCYSLAPVLAIAGVTQYVLFTWNFGRYNSELLQHGEHVALGYGAGISAFLAAMSGLPLFAHIALSNPDPREKLGGGAAAAMLAGAGVGSGGAYGSTGHSVGYGLIMPPPASCSQAPWPSAPPPSCGRGAPAYFVPHPASGPAPTPYMRSVWGS